MLDVDHFKALNDAFGHETGDRMLQAVGGFLGDETRHGDVACRFGGEEFVVVLPGASAQAAAARARSGAPPSSGSRSPTRAHDVGVTLSMGVAEYPAHAASADDLLRAADVALYEAKRQGRNRVVLASGGPRSRSAALMVEAQPVVPTPPAPAGSWAWPGPRR